MTLYTYFIVSRNMLTPFEKTFLSFFVRWTWIWCHLKVCIRPWNYLIELSNRIEKDRETTSIESTRRQWRIDRFMSYSTRTEKRKKMNMLFYYYRMCNVEVIRYCVIAINRHFIQWSSEKARYWKESLFLHRDNNDRIRRRRRRRRKWIQLYRTCLHVT
jgi:hypothetical protein